MYHIWTNPVQKSPLFSQIVCEVEVRGLDANVVLALDPEDAFD